MQIIKEITIDLNKATSYSIAFSVRQGDKGGRFIKAYLTADKVPFNIPETFTAVVKGMIDDFVVADDEKCTIDRTTVGKHFVLIPLTELMCAGYGNLELTLKLKEGEAVASAQSIWITVERDKTVIAKENYAALINEVNAVLDEVNAVLDEVNAVLDEVITIEDETTTGLKREKLHALPTALNETAGVLAVKGVEVPEEFGINNIPEIINEYEGEFMFSPNGAVYRGKMIFPETVVTMDLLYRDSQFLKKFDLSKTKVSLLGLGFLANNPNLEEVLLPLTLTTVNGQLCAECPLLEEIYLPKGIEIMGGQCFFRCRKLKTVFLPKSLKRISTTCFAECTSLEFVTFEAGFNCDGLKLSSSTLYSVETLVAMLEALADRTGQTAYTLTIGATNLAKLTEEQIAIATNKNWTLA